MLGETQAELHLEPMVITDRSTVLIIEDDPLQIDLLQDGLTRQGFHVLSSTTGNLGIKLAKSDLPDVILLDLSLPDEPESPQPSTKTANALVK